MQNCDGCILWIEFKIGQELRMDKLWNQKGIIEPSDVVVVGNLAARVKDQNHGANGVATSTFLVGRRVS